ATRSWRPQRSPLFPYTTLFRSQLARSGRKKPGFEGGQMPLYRRLPKRGFTNRNSKEIIAINVDVLNRFEDGAEVNVESLLESRRSEEHTSELQSRFELVCRLLL